MLSLVESNPYLRDAAKRRAANEETAYESSLFEGARGIQPPDAHPSECRKPRSRASLKNPVKAS
jgi:hypothetical protein